MQFPVLVDNTVLTNFAWVGRPDLLFALWPDRVCSPQAVKDEYLAGVKQVGLPASIWDRLPVIQLIQVEKQGMDDHLPDSLGPGERACLAIAFHQQGVFASDDFPARKLAQNLHVPVIGSTGILIECGRANLLNLPQAQHLLNEMIKAGYYAPINDLTQFFES